MPASEALLEEREATLRAKFAVTPAVATFLHLLRRSVRIVEPVSLPRQICRDKTDDVVLATAVAANADAIVTGDQDLLVLGSYEGISIAAPRAFLEGLDRSE